MREKLTIEMIKNHTEEYILESTFFWDYTTVKTIIELELKDGRIIVDSVNSTISIDEDAVLDELSQLKEHNDEIILRTIEKNAYIEEDNIIMDFDDMFYSDFCDFIIHYSVIELIEKLQKDSNEYLKEAICEQVKQKLSLI